MDIFDPPKFIECNIDDQLDIYSQIRKLKCFIFRGHRVFDWELSSSFEREYKKYPKSQMIEGAEKFSIAYFKQRFHLYDLELNKDSKLPDIISCMQHHGCPTRLVDFTKSFYVATYFAINDHKLDNSNYSIWAINRPVLNLKAQEMASAYFGAQNVDPEVKLKELAYELLRIKPNGVIPVETETISRRMSAQQGVLLAQTNIHIPFLKNICSMFGIGTEPEKVCFEQFSEINQNIVNNINIIKFNFNGKHVQRVRRELLSLNVTSGILFPDLNGLAKSAVEHLFWQY
jgi:FRG domain